MRAGSLSALLALCAPLAALANTDGEEDTLVINRITAQDFEVVESRQMAPVDFWCGAATFIERRSGLSENTPIYLRRARGQSVTQPGAKGVIFTLDPSDLPPPEPKRLTVTVEEVGAMLKSAHARRFCRDTFTRSTK
jgi:hypothetical protein